MSELKVKATSQSKILFNVSIELSLNEWIEFRERLENTDLYKDGLGEIICKAVNEMELKANISFTDEDIK